MENVSFADFPQWFTLRGHYGVFRIDPIRSRPDVVVLANVNGREVARCSLGELLANIDGPVQ